MKSPVIDIDQLSKYYGKALGIENVSLEVLEGEIFGFIGPNGAGKSTTIRILMNLIFPDKGNAKILGHDVTKEKVQIMKETGYVPADANTYSSLKVSDFLNYCRNFYDHVPDDHRINELAELMELDLTRKISDLSLGNRKKVSIVQSLLHRPKLLVLDEPTTGLDPLMQSRFFELLQMENMRGMTIFFSSHLLNEVQKICKRVAIIKEGKIISIEEIESLRRKQLKKVIIEFNNASDSERFNVTGSEINFQRNINTLSFMYSGDINDLLRELSMIRIDRITIEEPALEEIFMHFYS